VRLHPCADVGSREAEAASRARVARLVAAWAAEWPRRAASLRLRIDPPPAATPSALAAAPAPPLSPWRTFQLLLRRAARQAARDFFVNSTRAAASVVLGLAFGGLNYKLGHGQKSVARRGALLMQACINTAFLAMVKSLNGFPKERAVVRREVARGTAPVRAQRRACVRARTLLCSSPAPRCIPRAAAATAWRPTSWPSCAWSRH
jgi:hypothetical protein